MTISKALLVVVAIIAAYVTSLKPGDILFLVGAAFSLAASAFFPPLVLGVFWKRANKWGAIVGMAAGLGVCIYYMMRTYPFFTNMGVPKMDLWFGLNPISAGMFGLPVGIADDHRRQPAHARAAERSAGAGRARALSAPARRHVGERSQVEAPLLGSRQGPLRRALFVYAQHGPDLGGGSPPVSWPQRTKRSATARGWTERGKEARSETASRWTRTGYEATPSRASRHETAKLLGQTSGGVNPAVAR